MLSSPRPLVSPAGAAIWRVRARNTAPPHYRRGPEATRVFLQEGRLMAAEAFQSAAVPLDPDVMTLAMGEAARMETEELEELPPRPIRPTPGEYIRAVRLHRQQDMSRDCTD